MTKDDHYTNDNTYNARVDLGRNHLYSFLIWWVLTERERIFLDENMTYIYLQPLACVKLQINIPEWGLPRILTNPGHFLCAT